MPDEKALVLLNLLKQYHEPADWFEKNGDRLRALAFFGQNEKTDWDAARKALSAAEKLAELPSACRSESLLRLLSADHREATVEFSHLLKTLASAMDAIRAMAERTRISMNADTPSFRQDEIMFRLENGAERLHALTESLSLFRPHLISDISGDALISSIDRLNEYGALSDRIKEQAPCLRESFGFFFRDADTDWDFVLSLIERLQNIRKEAFYELLEPLLDTKEARKREFSDLSEKWTETHGRAKTTFLLISRQFSETALGDSVLCAQKKLLLCLDHMEELESYADYLEAKDACLRAGLSDFIEKLEVSDYTRETESVFRKRFYRLWLDAVCARSAAIRRFRRNTQDERIEKFIELDDLQLKIAQMRIREKLIENLPSHHQLLKATDEVSILNKELNKKRNIMPLRKLFRSIPNLLLTLKPCLMMSPLSVSYFLETEAYHFDLVIFDEASQIFPEDAVGAIFRGSQVIITGDSKQLPPTNFFSANVSASETETDQDEEDYEDLVSDSILEEAASALPNRTLLWHYRSKHESLISFSNREIYRNRLITFPNPANNVENMGVEYVYVKDGYYEGGGKNCNIREAETCVSLLEDHILQFPSRSLGIIAFSEKQQNAIESAITDFREQNPQHEWFFDESREEPFFVKNLENVQGDERDTIIFSICYAKDRSGKMAMRFGPLGVSGGERRLNVAVTRAKCNIKLVGSIQPSDIDLNKTKSEGVRMLRSYIEFAKYGNTALRPVRQSEDVEADDDFCRMIAEFLEKNGYRTQMQIGCSDYKIDIAVEHPENGDVFIAGIECDGMSYVHAKTARDRDHLRKTVLSRMGWRLYRVWSTEWIRHPEAEGEALLQFLREALKNHADSSEESPLGEEESAVSLEAIASESDEPCDFDRNSSPYEFPYDRETKPSSLRYNLEKIHYQAIGSNILNIVSAEQPIHTEWLYKRLAPTFVGGKITPTIKQTVDSILTKNLKDRIGADEERFLFLLPRQPICARIPQKNTTPRPMEYVHREEIAEVLLIVVRYSFGITADDLTGECARVFGFERKSPKIKQRIDMVMQDLISSERIAIVDGKVILSNACR
ncbi:MAG: hypothetical protein IJD59_01645 [Clostridia bacterium]|nr:hypothetical protein [Clostridia bacterium]